MKNFKLILKALFVVSMIFGLSACGDKDKKSSASVTRNTGRTSVNNNPFSPNNISVQNSSLGRITGSGDMTSTVADFIGVNASQLSTINGQNNTGIVFDGNVNINASQGHINIYILDAYAVQTGEAIVFRLDYAGLLQNGEMHFKDTFGGLVLDGYVVGSTFSGSAYYYATGENQLSPLGSFQVGAQNFIR